MISEILNYRLVFIPVILEDADALAARIHPNHIALSMLMGINEIAAFLHLQVCWV